MLSVSFNASFAERCLRQLEEGKPIGPLFSDGWTRDDAVTLAGVLRNFLLVKHAEDMAVDTMPLERQEAVVGSGESLIDAAIARACSFASAVNVGTYQERFHSVVIFTVTQDGDATVFNIDRGVRNPE